MRGVLGEEARLVAVDGKVMLNLFGELFEFNESRLTIECGFEGLVTVRVEGEISYSRDADFAMMERTRPA